MYRYFCVLAYNGENYHGWQEQPNAITVQEVFVKALRVLLYDGIEVVGCGRTDTGVHARKFVVHFELPELLPEDVLQVKINKLNRFLPPDIVVYEMYPVQPNAHARFTAVHRTYKYYITFVKSPFAQGTAWFVHQSLDVKQMQEALNVLKSYTDFTSFARLHSDNKTNNCSIQTATCVMEQGCLVITLKADRFLRNMVRAVVGTLVEVGSGKLLLDDFKNIIEAKNRGKAGTSAPAYALFLEDVVYPEGIRLQ